MTESNSQSFDRGYFIISLDLELFWGVVSSKTIEGYGDHILSVNQVVDDLLELFRQFGISATWATVGFLFHRDFEELKRALPRPFPRYENSSLSTYSLIENWKDTYAPYLFDSAIVERLRLDATQEIGSHTFSHLFSGAAGVTDRDFEADTESFNAAWKQQFNTPAPASFVFPRNQVTDSHLKILRKRGIKVYRGTENSEIFTGNELHKRAVRFADSVGNFVGHHIYDLAAIREQSRFGLLNLPSSRFLRPVSSVPKINSLRLRRIKRSMTAAATQRKIYHLWWHPHNFGTRTSDNLEMLRKILEHFSLLRNQYGFENRSMVGMLQVEPIRRFLQQNNTITS